MTIWPTIIWYEGVNKKHFTQTLLKFLQKHCKNIQKDSKFATT
jgi:hypothetical protein